MTRIRILSDLHLDHSNFRPELENIDILVLAGDIAGRNSLLESFLYYHVPADMPVIFVAGNHEYEHHDFHEKNDYLKSLSKEFNFHPLYNEFIVLDGIRFIGTPLFSNLKGFNKKHFPDGFQNNANEALKEWCMTHISDFKYIRHKNSLGHEGRWTVDDMFQEFDIAYQFLETELAKPFQEGKTVVVTHFSPLMDSASTKFGVNNKNSYWCNHLPELVDKADFWIHGHVHTPQTYMHNNCQIICNPRGYNTLSNLPQEATFQPDLKIEI